MAPIKNGQPSPYSSPSRTRALALLHELAAHGWDLPIESLEALVAMARRLAESEAR